MKINIFFSLALFFSFASQVNIKAMRENNISFLSAAKVIKTGKEKESRVSPAIIKVKKEQQRKLKRKLEKEETKRQKYENEPFSLLNESYSVSQNALKVIVAEFKSAKDCTQAAYDLKGKVKNIISAFGLYSNPCASSFYHLDMEKGSLNKYHTEFHTKQKQLFASVPRELMKP